MCIITATFFRGNHSCLHTIHMLRMTRFCFSTNFKKCSKYLNIIERNFITLPHYMTISYLEEKNKQLLPALLKDMTVLNDFITVDEEQHLMLELEPILRRKRYEFDHWDDAIHGFRETEKLDWNSNNKLIIERIKLLAFDSKSKDNILEHVHVLDLSKDGQIKPHVDSIRFCGHTITGLSLLSDSVMRLTRSLDEQVLKEEPDYDNKVLSVDVLLKRRSLYIMRHSARYLFAHEILHKEHSQFQNQSVLKERRVSVICRNRASDNK